MLHFYPTMFFPAWLRIYPHHKRDTVFTVLAIFGPILDSTQHFGPRPKKFAGPCSTANDNAVVYLDIWPDTHVGHTRPNIRIRGMVNFDSRQVALPPSALSG